MSRNPTLLKRIALVGAVLAIGAAIAVGGRAWHQFSSSDIQFPNQPAQHFGQLSGAGRHDFWRVAIDAFAEKPVLGIGAGTYQFAWDQHRSIDMTVLDAHSLYLEAFAELGAVGGLLVLALIGTLLWTGFSAWRAAQHPERDRYAALFAAMLAFAVGAAFDWFWEIAGLGAVFFLAAGVLVSVRCAQLAGEPGVRRKTSDGRNYGLAVAGLALAWIAAIVLIGPLLVEHELAASRSAAAGGNVASAVDHANTARSIEPWAASPYVQLGLLAELQGEYTAAAGRLSQAIEREGRNWQLYYLRSRAERKAGDTAGAEADLAQARQLNPLQPCLRGNGNCEWVLEVMTRNAQETAARKAQASPPSPSAPRQPPRTDLAARLGLTGVAGARRRGALLRRLLAAGDWAALAGALCLATAVTSTTDIATLFWAVMFSPIWILILKLHGLYDNDHRRIRHSTLDELPSLVSASALGTLALDGLLALSPAGPLSPESAILVGVGALVGSFLARAALRVLWHRLIGVAAGVVIGPADTVAVVARRVATHPETRLHLVGYLSPGHGDDTEPQGLLRLGSGDDIARVAREHEVEWVIVTEQEMSESATERLIEECKAAGLGLTFLPQHYGLLGPGIELNRLAELPVLDFRFSDPPRSTVALKRALDLVVSVTMPVLLSPLLLAIALFILLDSGRPVLFCQRRIGKDGEPFTMVKFRTMDADAEERLGSLVDLEKLDQPAFKIRDDPRVTRAGRLLRRTSLDELPQLVNVLRGQMSLVGPRPEEEAIVALYDERQRIRLAVKPGITGPMQVYGRSDLTFEERLAMERDYLDNLSVTGDLAILLRTPGAIVRGDGAY